MAESPSCIQHIAFLVFHFCGLLGTKHCLLSCEMIATWPGVAITPSCLVREPRVLIISSEGFETIVTRQKTQ